MKILIVKETIFFNFQDTALSCVNCAIKAIFTSELLRPSSESFTLSRIMSSIRSGAVSFSNSASAISSASKVMSISARPIRSKSLRYSVHLDELDLSLEVAYVDDL
jgi:hypothetical protein